MIVKNENPMICICNFLKKPNQKWFQSLRNEFLKKIKLEFNAPEDQKYRVHLQNVH
jgi:hypothetical protein